MFVRQKGWLYVASPKDPQAAKLLSLERDEALQKKYVLLILGVSGMFLLVGILGAVPGLFLSPPEMKNRLGGLGVFLLGVLGAVALMWGLKNLLRQTQQGTFDKFVKSQRILKVPNLFSVELDEELATHRCATHLPYYHPDVYDLEMIRTVVEEAGSENRSESYVQQRLRPAACILARKVQRDQTAPEAGYIATAEALDDLYNQWPPWKGGI